MKTQLAKPAREKARYTDEYKEQALELWRRTDAPLFKKVETLRWRGATPAFAAWAERMEAPHLLAQCEKAAGR
jgi:hypothetical protein